MEAALGKVMRSGFVFWLLFLAVGGYLVWPLKEHIKFGIDLVGGTYITLEVKTEQAVNQELVERMQDFMKKLQQAGLDAPASYKVEQETMTLTFADRAALSNVQTLANEALPGLKISTDNNSLVARFPDKVAERIKEEAVTRNIEVLRTRLGVVSEIPIAGQGDRNIVIEMPDVADPQQAKALIGKPAHLEIKLVEGAASSEDQLLEAYGGDVPDGLMVLPGKGDGVYGKREYYLVPEYTDLTGRLLRDANVGFGGKTGSNIVVNFEFKPEGGQKFSELTGNNIGRRVAVIVDNVVISAPMVNTAIGDKGYIEGSFTTEDAKELATMLKSGAFVAPVEFIEERQIGPSLGQESIRQGLLSCLVGLALLFLFSLFYYKVSGLFAFVALLYNLAFILFGLSWLRATLTLPGIAGMVLTVGMAIDASVLIYERIKEELAAGVGSRAAVASGFKEAMSVILDGNITTFIVGIVLYKFGTGPIQGFAATMMLGIVATLITGLFFLRSLFSFVFDVFCVKKISI